MGSSYKIVEVKDGISVRKAAIKLTSRLKPCTETYIILSDGTTLYYYVCKRELYREYDCVVGKVSFYKSTVELDAKIKMFYV